MFGFGNRNTRNKASLEIAIELKSQIEVSAREADMDAFVSRLISDYALGYLQGYSRQRASILCNRMGLPAKVVSDVAANAVLLLRGPEMGQEIMKETLKLHAAGLFVDGASDASQGDREGAADADCFEDRNRRVETLKRWVTTGQRAGSAFR